MQIELSNDMQINEIYNYLAEVDDIESADCLRLIVSELQKKNITSSTRDELINQSLCLKHEVYVSVANQVSEMVVKNDLRFS